MKKDYTHITVVLDRSGSMASIKNDTIGSFNTFLEDQKSVPSEATITLVQFDDKFETVYDMQSVHRTQNLDDKTFIPRGSTALLDALGKTINELGTTLSNMKEEDRPERVLFVIMTDGEENASREFNRQQIFDMIKHQQDAYAWKFIFLGANQDAIHEAQTIGIGAGMSLSFAGNARGIDMSMKKMSSYTKSYRAAPVMAAMAMTEAFDDQDRKDQEDAGAQKSK